MVENINDIHYISQSILNTIIKFHLMCLTSGEMCMSRAEWPHTRSRQCQMPLDFRFAVAGDMGDVWVPVKGEDSTSIYADWANEKIILKSNRKNLGKFWISNHQELLFFKVLVDFLYAVLSGGIVLISVMSQQYNSIMELNFVALFMKMYLPSTFILRYVRAKMIVHAFMIELDQLDYWYPKKY